ncbi:MAG: GNAT family N-acetyltransferase [Phocaeicola sp.]
MIKLRKIKTTDEKEYTFVENLLVTAFPEVERRENDAQRFYTDNNSHFHCYIIEEEEQLIGFVNLWKFDIFCYVEHIAIDPNLRNGGYGKQLLDKIKEIAGNLPIILEVEHPNDEMSSRRINFYKRADFTLHELPYIQPPYRVGGQELPLYLMSYGNINMEREYKKIKSEIHREVYNQLG